MNLADNLLRVRLALNARVGGVVALVEVEVPEQVLEALVARLGAVGIELLEAQRQLVGEPGVGAAVARRVGGLLVPLDPALGVGEAAVHLGHLGRREQEDLGLDGGGGNLAALDLGRAVPERRRLGLEVVLDHQPVELAHGLALEPPVDGRGRVLAHSEHALDLAVAHANHHRHVRVVAVNLGVPVVAEVVVLGGRVAVHGLEVADQELGHVGPVARRQRLGLEVVLERVVRLEGRRRRHVAVDAVVEGRDVGAALDGSVAAQGEDAATRPAHVAQQQLEQRRRANHLDTVGVLGPGHGVAEGAGAVGARVGRQRLGHLEEDVLRAARHPLDHLRRVAREVAADNLEHAARVLQRLVALGRGLAQRAHQFVKRRPLGDLLVLPAGLALLVLPARLTLRRLLVLLTRLDALLARLGRVGGAALVANGRAAVLPGLAVVRGLEPVHRVALVLHQAGEHAVQVLAVLVVVVDDGRGVGVVDDVLAEVLVVLDDVANQAAQEGDV